MEKNGSGAGGGLVADTSRKSRRMTSAASFTRAAAGGADTGNSVGGCLLGNCVQPLLLLQPCCCLGDSSRRILDSFSSSSRSFWGRERWYNGTVVYMLYFPSVHFPSKTFKSAPSPNTNKFEAYCFLVIISRYALILPRAWW